jgi:uncharacterized protein YehS (DUF1456 family)
MLQSRGETGYYWRINLTIPKYSNGLNQFKGNDVESRPSVTVTEKIKNEIITKETKVNEVVVL